MASNADVTRRFLRAWIDNDVAVLDELGDPDLIDHNPAPGQSPDWAGFKQTIAGYKMVFPDFDYDLHAVIAEGDLVASHWTAHGTHQGELFGVPPTGNKVSLEGINIYRIKDGRVCEVWTQADQMALLQQIGAMG